MSLWRTITYKWTQYSCQAHTSRATDWLVQLKQWSPRVTYRVKNRISCRCHSSWVFFSCTRKGQVTPKQKELMTVAPGLWSSRLWTRSSESCSRSGACTKSPCHSELWWRRESSSSLWETRGEWKRPAILFWAEVKNMYWDFYRMWSTVTRAPCCVWGAWPSQCLPAAHTISKSFRLDIQMWPV